jgi:outer membrane protein
MRSATKAWLTGKFCFKEHLFNIAFLCVLACCTPIVCRSVQVLDYDEVTAKALRNAHDIRMSKLDIAISQASLKRAYSLYYPTLSARWNTEYVKDQTDGTAQVNVIGNTVLTQNTLYQSSFMFVSNYNLFDFGATGKKTLIAKKDVDAKKAMYNQSVRDVKLKVLNIYLDLLTSYEELAIKKELLTLYKDLSLTKERLYTAGTISKIDMVDEAVKTVKIVDDIDNLNLKLKTLLEDLSLYTGEPYGDDSVKVIGFKGYEESFRDTFNPENTPESRIYEREIEKKKAELQVLQRGLLPQLALYSSYTWYASHPDEIDTSAQYIKPRNFIVGLSITVPLFEGFKSPAEIEKARLEMERLRVEKAKKLSELSGRYAKLNEAHKTYASSVANQQEMLTKVEENLAMADRLIGQKTMEWTDFLTRKIELVNQKFELTKAMIIKIANIKEIQILSEARD